MGRDRRGWRQTVAGVLLGIGSSLAAESAVATTDAVGRTEGPAPSAAPKGDVIDARILRSLPLLDRHALEAVGCWKYNPAIQNGRPVEVYFTVVVTFSLK